METWADGVRCGSSGRGVEGTDVGLTSGRRSLLTRCSYSRVPQALLLTKGPDSTAIEFSLLYLPNTEVYNKRKEK